MAGIVLTDASPLIALAQVGGLPWLPSLFGPVWVPQELWAEVVTGRGLPGERLVEQAAETGGLRRTGPAPTSPGLPDLDEGEAACIRLALAHRAATGEPALLLMDERAGRQIAHEHGLQVAGTAAVVGLARSRGLIGPAREVFARLHGTNFRIAPDVITTVLKRVGES